MVASADQDLPHGRPDLLWKPVLASALAAGIPHCEDPNGAEQDGIAQMEATVNGGVRSSSARAYLYPAMDRANLTIETDALAGRIVVERGRATSVQYRQRGQVKTVHAVQEIIVSGGAFNSPTCCCFRASVQRMNCAPWASVPSMICPAWGAI